MHHRLRYVARAMLILSLAVGLASPVAAATSLGHEGTTDLEKSVPVVVDVLVLRPLGLVMTMAGVMFYAVPVAPLTAITRPSDIGKPFHLLVATPARYTFADPLGQH